MRKSLAIISTLLFLAIAATSAFARCPDVIAVARSAPKTDAEIQKCITDKLAAAPSLKTQSISASVSNGVATLTGKVKNAGSKGAATNLAKGCGATSVTNNLTIGEADDGEIQKCISDKFAASPSLKTQNFSVTVSQGVATLTGTAKDPGSKGAATNIAKSCGAKSVTNNITVAAKPKSSNSNSN